MSDGNFNRSHLPKNDFQSGVRAGKAIEHKKALQAFTAYLEQYEATLPPAEKELRQTAYRQLIDSML